MTDEPPQGHPYLEHLRTPWWWYGVAVLVAILLGAEFAMAVSGWLSWLPLTILLPLCLLVVWRLSSARIEVTRTKVRVADRCLPLAAIDTAIGLSHAELLRLVGRHADPAAYTFIRSWIGPGVQLVLNSESTRRDATPESDPAEPYWVLSTRHPDRLLAALAAGSVPVR